MSRIALWFCGFRFGRSPVGSRVVWFSSSLQSFRLLLFRLLAVGLRVFGFYQRRLGSSVLPARRVFVVTDPRLALFVFYVTSVVFLGLLTSAGVFYLLCASELDLQALHLFVPIGPSPTKQSFRPFGCSEGTDKRVTPQNAANEAFSFVFRA